MKQKKHLPVLTRKEFDFIKAVATNEYFDGECPFHRTFPLEYLGFTFEDRDMLNSLYKKGCIVKRTDGHTAFVQDYSVALTDLAKDILEKFGYTFTE